MRIRLGFAALAGLGLFVARVLSAQPAPASATPKPDTPELAAKLTKLRKDAGPQWEAAVHFWCEAPRANRADDPQIPATKIFDNVYAIGNSGTAVYVVQTTAGLVMIDSLAANEGETQLLPGFQKLGLDPAKVKTILVAHGHGDHFGGSAYFQQKYDSRVYLAIADWAVMERAAQNQANAPVKKANVAAPPRHDGELKDGEPVVVGGVSFTPVAIPGHTPGSMGFVFPVKDNGRTHMAALFGGAWLTTVPLTDEVAQQYIKSIAHFREATKKAKVDVALANHPLMMPFQESLDHTAARKKGEANPFVVGQAGYQKFLDVMQGCTELAVARKKL